MTKDAVPNTVNGTCSDPRTRHDDLTNKLIFFTLIWPYDPQRRLVWEIGGNTGFWINVAQAIIFSTLAILAFHQPARVTKPVDTVGGHSIGSASANKPDR
jgi:hypothetical protein